jgi:8-oxo-dGTP diphosphatase
MTSFKTKAWLEKKGNFVIGEGYALLLRKIEDTGSINEAAKHMKMSYRHAWGILREISEALGEDVVESSRGGKGGGKSRLTEAGKLILEEYSQRSTGLKKYLKGNEFLKPSLTVDGVVLYKGKIVLIKRKNPPFKGKFALPGGFVEYNERVEEAVVREVKEETGLKTEISSLLGVYSTPDRDPRGHTVSVVFRLEVKGGKLKSGSDAQGVELFEIGKVPELAFDHNEILNDTFA